MVLFWGNAFKLSAYIICRETLPEEINFVFTYDESFDANFSNLGTFFLAIIAFQKIRYPKHITIIPTTRIKEAFKKYFS